MKAYVLIELEGPDPAVRGLVRQTRNDLHRLVRLVGDLHCRDIVLRDDVLPRFHTQQDYETAGRIMDSVVEKAWMLHTTGEDDGL